MQHLWRIANQWRRDTEGPHHAEGSRWKRQRRQHATNTPVLPPAEDSPRSNKAWAIPRMAAKEGKLEPCTRKPVSTVLWGAGSRKALPPTRSQWAFLRGCLLVAQAHRLCRWHDPQRQRSESWRRAGDTVPNP